MDTKDEHVQLKTTIDTSIETNAFIFINIVREWKCTASQMMEFKTLVIFQVLSPLNLSKVYHFIHVVWPCCNSKRICELVYDIADNIDTLSSNVFIAIMDLFHAC